MVSTDIACEFRLDEELIYLNHAAVSPWPRRTTEAVQRFADENLHFGSRDYPGWLKTEARLRQRMANLIDAASSDDIALVKNTSEALSFVAYGLEWTPGDNVVISNQEFPSNRIVWESLEPRGVQVRAADLHSVETPEDALLAAVDANTRVLSVSSVQYATGLRLDLARLGRFCRQRGILFCVDAIQSLGALAFDVEQVQADFVMADGHKWMLGPEGLGLFYSRPQARERLSLTQYGWHMVERVGDFDQQRWQPAESSRRFECGSPNMLGVHALEASLSLLLDVGMAEVERCVLENTAYLIDRLTHLGLDVLTSTRAERHAGIVTFRVPGNTEALYRELMAAGIMCAHRGGGIRFSPHFYTETARMDRALAELRSRL